jgi:hypothetical protein
VRHLRLHATLKRHKNWDKKNCSWMKSLLITQFTTTNTVLIAIPMEEIDVSAKGSPLGRRTGDDQYGNAVENR